MFCSNCGKEVHEKAVACPSCGVPPRAEKKFCNNCGAPIEANQALCTQCGVAIGGNAGTGEKSKVAAGLLGIFLGALGIHKYYLGYNKEGTIMLLVTLIGGVLTCGVVYAVVSVIGLVEGILYLTKSDDEFQQMYVDGQKTWF